jgi:GTP-binding protein
MDIRHPLTEIDQRMIGWGIAAELPLLLLLSKADKLKRSHVEHSVRSVRKTLASASVPVEVLAFSAVDRRGLVATQARLGDWLGRAEQG